MRFLVHAAPGVFVLVAVAASSACGPDSGTVCTPKSEGFLDTEVVERTVILETERPAGACTSRVKVVRAEDALRKLYADLQLGEAPMVDFTRNVVVLREGTRERAIRFVVARDDAVMLAVQGCTAEVPNGCLLEIFSLPISSPVRGEERSCETLNCGAVPSDPS